MKMISKLTRFVFLLAFSYVSFTANAQVKLLDPSTQTKFVNPLPLPGAAQPVSPGGSHYEISMTQFQQDLGLKHPTTGQPLMTTVWGYNGSYPGPTIEARKNSPVTVLWKNELKDGSGNPLPHPLPVDTTLHMARPAGWPNTGVPVVVHLHGGHNESASDGLPESWFTPGYGITGPSFVKQTSSYAMNQDAATIWYHDHALGITRLNVYMGLAGFCIVRDSLEESLNLPSGNYDIPLAIQDRMFYEDGSLYYPTVLDSAGNPTTRMKPEMFGNFILVNGKTWPVLEVEPRKYRFRLLNGSDSRFYNLSLPNNVSFHVIGSDGGLLNAPVTKNTLLLAPGERIDVIVDFSDPLLLTQTLIMMNDANTPFPNGDPVETGLTDQIMAFKVTKSLSGVDNSVIPQTLRANPIPQLANPNVTRQLILAEDEDSHGGLISNLGTSAGGPMDFFDPITENPKLNDTELWEIINTTPDAHPIHLHLVSYQVVNRQRYDTATYQIGQPSTLQLIGNPIEPDPKDKGWKDTYTMFPGEVTRIIAKFQQEGLYVWHCHILTHEDHEMMRPYYVGDIPTSVKDKFAKTNNHFNVQVFPNPSNGQLNITFQLEKTSNMDVAVYNMLGERIAVIQNGQMTTGTHNLIWNGETSGGKAVPNGVYLCRVRNGNTEKAFKLIRTN